MLAAAVVPAAEDNMNVYIVTLPTLDGTYEAAAVVVAESETEAVRVAVDECSYEVSHREVECEQVCEEEPCIHWLT